MDERYYTVKEIAQLLQIKETTVRQKIRGKELRAIQIGGEYRIGSGDLADYLRRQATMPAENEADGRVAC
jgi:excisionase family DNA binding protein